MEYPFSAMVSTSFVGGMDESINVEKSNNPDPIRYIWNSFHVYIPAPYMWISLFLMGDFSFFE